MLISATRKSRLLAPCGSGGNLSSITSSVIEIANTASEKNTSRSSACAGAPWCIGPSLASSLMPPFPPVAMLPASTPLAKRPHHPPQQGEESGMSDQSVYPVPADWAKRAKVNRAGYEKLYGRSLAAPGSFWLEQARRLDWITRPEIAGDWSFDKADFHISWFAAGVLNVSANCLDRHLAKNGDTVALIWEPDDPAEEPKRITYRQLPAQECRFANALKDRGDAKSNRVTINLQ